MPNDPPAAPAVRESLDRLLASETFSRSDRARKLLAYLVERELAGEADRLKGFAIAVDVFGKTAGFDPSTDAVVRVQARRLRELLAQYYKQEGADEPLRIVIPRGSYAPAYEWVDKPCPRTDAEAPALPAAAIALDETLVLKDFPAFPGLPGAAARAKRPRQAEFAPLPDAAIALAGPTGLRNFPAFLGLPAVPTRARRQLRAEAGQVMRHVHLFWAAMAVVIAMLGFVVLRLVDPMPAAESEFAARAAENPAETGAIPAGALQEMLPLVHIALTGEDDDAIRVAGVMRTALAGFDTVDFIGRDYAADAGSSAVDAVRFLFQISPGPDEGTVRVELQHLASGKVLAARVLSAAEARQPALDDEVADFLSSTVPVSGTIYSHIEQSGTQSGLIACLLLNDDYYLDQEPAKLEAAYRCFEALAARDAKSPLVYSELAALHLEAATDSYPYPPDATPEQALALAHRAVLSGATSPYAHRAYGFVNSRTGNADESIRYMRKAYELNTFDLSMAAAYGYGLIFSGNYREGTPIMTRAVEASSAHPSWWDYGLFLGAMMLDDMDRAGRATDALATARRPHYLAARIVAAHAEGRAATVTELSGELAQAFPKFTADPAATFRRSKYPVDMVDKFIAALRAAGLGSAS